jgi:hypothetical protein
MPVGPGARPRRRRWRALTISCSSGISSEMLYRLTLTGIDLPETGSFEYRSAYLSLNARKSFGLPETVCVCVCVCVCVSVAHLRAPPLLRSHQVPPHFISVCVCVCVCACVLRNSPVIKFDDSRKCTSNTPNTPTLNYYPTNPPCTHHHPHKSKNHTFTYLLFLTSLFFSLRMEKK